MLCSQILPQKLLLLSKEKTPHLRLLQLSETCDKAFDESKVGKNTIGKYIMMAGNRSYKGKPYQSMIVYKIVLLTSNKLVVESGNLDKLKITYISD